VITADFRMKRNSAVVALPGSNTIHSETMHIPILLIVYLLSCLLMGVLGINRKFGFWGYFFGSIILTPVVGLLLILASDPKKSR
jgi:uncharacterized membrane protein